MNEVIFKSVSYPEMNYFWERLQKALDNNVDNPKPSCEGFYLAYWNPKKCKMVVEKIGIVPKEKEYKYLNFAAKKLSQTLQFGAVRSKEFEDNEKEQYPGSFTITTDDGIFGAAVSGHDSAIDEAISCLWLAGKQILSELAVTSSKEGKKAMMAFADSDFFFELIQKRSFELKQIFAPDNEWIVTLGASL